jgi:hypothetical protein
MFLWINKYGQISRLMNGHSDTGEEYGPGRYFLPNLFPFARDIDLHLGYHFELIQDLYKGLRGSEFHHHVDTRDARVIINATARSPTHAYVAQGTNGLIRRFFSIHGRDGRIEYYRVGRICFFFLTLAALVGNVVAPSHAKHDELVAATHSGTVTEQASSTPSHEITVLAQLAKGPRPIFPSDEHFNGSATWSTFLIEKRKYVHYRESGTGETPSVRSDGPHCFIVPAGKKISIASSTPPVFVINMMPEAKYHQKYEYAAWWKREVGNFIKKDGAPAWTSVQNSEPWAKLFDEWNTVETVSPITAEALPLEKILDRKLGGLVCF